MSIAEYRKLTKQDDVPLESVECQRFSMRLTELVNMGLVVKYSHIANESKDRMANIRNQRVGVRAGCPDYVIVLKNKVVFVEMKRVKGGTVSKEQADWILAINAAGGYARVCKGCDDAMNYVESQLE